MSEYRLGKYPQSSILVIFSERKDIQLDPDYQRIGGIWTKESRQLLIDSLLNGFDVPKLYFHEFVPAKRIAGRAYRYAIIDGQQRLRSIWDFIEGAFPLADDFEYLKKDDVTAGGLSYAELGREYPELKSRFDATPLDIVTIQTDDLNLIEDMFSRLNEAIPLNAPEKRNAFGGPLPRAIRALARHTFFPRNVPFKDARYRHRDLAAKFLYIEHSDALVNTKKTELDEFVRDYKKWRGEKDKRASTRRVKHLRETVENALASMSRLFTKNDPLLRQVGMVTLYYYIAREKRAERVKGLNRAMLGWFEGQRLANRAKAEAGKRADQSLLEFDSHSQTPNDAYALRIRLSIILEFLSRKYDVDVDPELMEELA